MNNATALDQDLKKILSPATIFPDDAAREKFNRDWWGQTLWWERSRRDCHTPVISVRPALEDDIAPLLQWCQERGIAVVPRGGGSGVCGAAMALKQDSLVLDMLGLNKIQEVKPNGEGALVTAQGGILGGALEQGIQQQGYSLMHIPASLDISTLGGWISTKSFGQMSTLYGGIGEQVENIRCVFPDGNVKNLPAGDLLGSEGTLGVITSAQIQVKRQDENALYFSCRFPRFNEALAFIRNVIRRDIRPPVLRLYDPLETKTSSLAGKRHHQNGNDSRLKWQARALQYPKIFQWLEPLGLINSEWLLIAIFEPHQRSLWDETQKIAVKSKIKTQEAPARSWNQRRFQWNIEKILSLRRVGCFVDTLDMWASWERLPELYRNIINQCSPLAMTMGHLSHFDNDGACLYVIFAGRKKTETDTLKLYETLWATAMETCIASGGLINHHHGLGIAKLPWKFHGYPMRWFNHHRYLKNQWDPKGIMNPGKITG
ncbi:MAG: FAD-binding oxidoreductase [Elusimicrobia bacterium]|nr:FAD-binding oxidoreductase [Elusimicrobiota bacterium]